MATIKLILSYFSTLCLLSLWFHVAAGFLLWSPCTQHIPAAPPPHASCDGNDRAHVSKARLLLSQPGSDASAFESHTAEGMPVLTHAVDAVFGWQLQFTKPYEGAVIREELILPKPSSEWNVSALTQLSDDGRVSVTEFCDVATDHTVEHLWALTKGDPKGIYTLRVWVNGEHAETFEFLVQ